MTAPAPVEELRTALDQAEINWAPVRDFPNATYLTDSRHTICWTTRSEGPAFEWGHLWEYRDRTVEDVIERYQKLPEALSG